MAKQYYYCPFDTPDATTQDTTQKYQNKGAGRCVMCPPTVVYRTGAYVNIIGAQGALKVVPNDGVLLIDGHGSSLGSAGRDNTGLAAEGNEPVIAPTTNFATNNDVALTPYRLTCLLIKEGLDFGHVLVRLLTCYGAGPAAAYDGVNPVKMAQSYLNRKDYEADGFFARLLAQSMCKRGFKKVIVGGYTGPVVNNAGSGQTTVRRDALASSADRVAASTDRKRYMAWYDGQGNKINKPVSLP